MIGIWDKNIHYLSKSGDGHSEALFLKRLKWDGEQEDTQEST